MRRFIYHKSDAEIMAVFSSGEMVKIVEPERYSEKIYLVKNKKKTKNGILYLLKSVEEESVLRLYYENNQSLLERIY
jgi:hypothetical protein